ncbi:MAG TPA: hypothetical protein VHL11_01045 [Phototrophicaceae bacterium]|nr:hypothetical protein [Phototrophicaceae bacterium]
MQPTSLDLSPGTTSPGQQQLDQALMLALDAGREAIVDQIHFILACSQMLALPPSNKGYRPSVLNVVEARLAAVIEFAAAVNAISPITPEQARVIYRSTRVINDSTVRLNLQTRLLKSMPLNLQPVVIRDIWKQIDQLEDPVEQIRILVLMASLEQLPEAEQHPSDPLQEIIQIAGKIPGIEARLRSLVALAINLPAERATPIFERILNDLEFTPDALRGQIISQIAPKIGPVLHQRLYNSLEKIKNPADRARGYVGLSLAMPQDRKFRLTALNAIALIPNEDECVEALIEFTPGLEEASITGGYPETLQHALSIIVGLSRRPLRAKALVALTPYLTPDLKGEALAAVHSVGNERERASLLASLAPGLTPSMLIASLAVAHSMREPDARAHALRVLANYVPDNARSQTLRDALNAATALINPLERIQALIALFDVLPDDLKDQTGQVCLKIIKSIENENARARAISLISPYLTESMLPDTLEEAAALEDSQQRLNALVSLMPRLSGEQYQQILDILIGCAYEMPFEYRRARALVSIAAFLTPDVTSDMLTMIDAIHDPYDRVNSYLAVAQHLPPDQRPPIITKAWSLVRKIDDGYDRASAIVAIAPYLPAQTYPDTVKLARGVLDIIGDEYDKASAISILAPLLTDETLLPPLLPHLPTYLEVLTRAVDAILAIPQQNLRTQLLAETIPFWLRLNETERFILWRECAVRLKALPLADVLLCLSVIVPVIRVVGGDQNIDKITRLLDAQRDKQPGSKQLKTGGEGHER